jgi:hypothetical protein
MAATPEHMRSQRVLDENTDVSSIAITPRWREYLDKTYQLPVAKKGYVC